MVKRDEKGRFVRTKPDYKAMYEQSRKDWKELDLKLQSEKNYSISREGIWNRTIDERNFLLDHAPFWLRWMYNCKFKE